MKRLLFIVILTVYCAVSAFSQQYSFTDTDIESRITKDVSILASDSLEGRESGTYGEWMARQYIAGQFAEAGLKPMFLGNSYFQQFTYEDSPWYGRGNGMWLNGKTLKLYQDYYALTFTGCDSLVGETVSVGYGISMPEEGIDDYAGKENLEGKIFVIYTSLPENFKKNPAVEQLSGKIDKVNLAIKKGARAVIFILPENETVEPNASISDKETVVTVPVIYLRSKNLLNATEPNKVKLAVNVVRDEYRPAYNVAGYIDNGADQWVVIGGHYDHLGWTMDNNGKPVVNNGADDNASGTAAMMELARFLKQSDLKKNNYVFCAFSGEEKGLIGSTYFTNSRVIENEKINYMLDLDMIGKLNDKRAMTLFGTGTSPVWNKAISKANEFKLKLKKSKSGVGGSDHMPFYFKDIPALFLHTGLHPDYHTPADDIDKLNYKGMVDIIKYTQKLIEYMDAQGKIPFEKTSALQAVWGATKMM